MKRSWFSITCGTLLTFAIAAAGLTYAVWTIDDFGRDHSPASTILVLLIGGAFYGMLAQGPIGSAIARMLAGNPISEDSGVYVAVERERMIDPRFDDQRVAALEERLDFAERMIANRQAPQMNFNTPTS